MHIACNKYFISVCLILSVFRLNISACIEFYFKCISNVFLASQKSGGNEYDVGIEYLFGVGYFFHIHSSGFWVFFLF